MIVWFGNGNNNRNTIHSRFLRHLGYHSSPWKTKIKPFATGVLGDHFGPVSQWVLTMVSTLDPLWKHSTTVDCHAYSVAGMEANSIFRVIWAFRDCHLVLSLFFYLSWWFGELYWKEETFHMFSLICFVYQLLLSYKGQLDPITQSPPSGDRALTARQQRDCRQ